jgi:hypothetical protein
MAAPALADWKRYENDYFVVYSQGKSKVVEQLVRELELFRAAALQVFSVRAPDDAPKTMVVIAKNRKEYRDFGGSDRIDGFARREGAQTLIVISASGMASRNMRTARHEYAHALLGYSEIDYPNWYEEGFAELASLIDIDEESESFVLGLGTRRRIGARVLAVPWNQLIEDDFNLHRLPGMAASNAYGQAWLLMHFLAIGPDRENAQRLGAYLASVRQGTPSAEAFQAAFGRMPDDIWQNEMQGYSEQLPYYRLRFRGLTLDDDFGVGPAPPDEVESLLLHLQASDLGAAAKRLEEAPPGEFDGYWAKPGFSNACHSVIDVRHDSEAGGFRILWQAGASDDAPRDPVEYSVPEVRKGIYRLKQLTETGDEHGVVPEINLSLREGGWMCIAHPDDYEKSCELAFRRCPAPENGGASRDRT